MAQRRFAPSNGLGPAYNGVSCGSCHEKPTVGGGASRYRTVLVGSGARDTFTVPFERHFTVDSISLQTRGPATTTRTPPPFFGVGLLAEIPVDEILAHADPNDSDHDGVRGRVNFERGFVGRFGRKAQLSSITGFVRLALLDHLGVTSDSVDAPRALLADPGPVQLPTRDADPIADPEVSDEDLADLVAFTAFLAPPTPDPPTDVSRAGEALFSRIGCATCHVPSLHGPRGPVFAYTDLLLHDMGPELADGVAVGDATGTEFRTQPLWGLGVAGPFLHDGRADTVDDAIRMHGGEGAGATARYQALTDADRESLRAFLRSLGGSDRRSDGMLDRNTPIPVLGEVGAPIVALDQDEAERFARGRAVFDHDFSKAEGLGNLFNGDACRSCHFDPVIGGAGPADVDVIRYGSLLPDGTFVPPPSNETLARRFDLTTGRPPFSGTPNLFERRQTPSLLGLGLVDAIAEDVLIARADPDDVNGDGIRGVVGRVADGRVGRFGWKGQAATLEAFVRDAFDKELGISGAELPAAPLGDLLYFLRMLAPPPERPLGPDEERGRETFQRVGCDRCHVSALPGPDGRPVGLFSDLLLHDVAPPGTHFVVQGTERLFRTPPLWGISATPPYLHDGSAETLDAAVRRHDGEAAKVRDLYTAASEEEREALLKFLGAL